MKKSTLHSDYNYVPIVLHSFYSQRNNYYNNYSLHVNISWRPEWSCIPVTTRLKLCKISVSVYTLSMLPNLSLSREEGREKTKLLVQKIMWFLKIHTYTHTRAHARIHTTICTCVHVCGCVYDLIQSLFIISFVCLNVYTYICVRERLGYIDISSTFMHNAKYF